MESYRIVVPSRKREKTIGQKTLKLIPDATVIVHESEVENYKKYNPDANIVGHDQKGIPSIRQWALDNFDEETIVFVDDDLIGVDCLVGERERVYTNPENIKQIIENSIQIIEDLDLHLFGYNRSFNPILFKPTQPFRFTGFVAGAFGVRGRRLHFDTNLRVKGEDVDISLQALLIDRIIFFDNRFYFDFGPTMTGEGGLQGVRNSDDIQHDIEYLHKKWGKYVSLEHINKLKTGRNTVKVMKTGVRINVERKSKYALH